jgi:aminoglycoside 6'-N-acetyltransferase I
MSVRIMDFPFDNPQAVQQAAQILVDAFAQDWPDAWPDLVDGIETMKEFNTPERICRAALDQSGVVTGWIGGLPEYDGHTWELHPLAVRPDQQGQGIGRALVEDLVEQVRRRGGLTIMLGTDDENNMTSVSGIDLYPDPLAHLKNIRSLKRHPYLFYEKMGFVVVGIIPDANGFGKPDILMTRRVDPKS